MSSLDFSLSPLRFYTIDAGEKDKDFTLSALRFHKIDAGEKDTD
jgi:hypothetical protein